MSGCRDPGRQFDRILLGRERTLPQHEQHLRRIFAVASFLHQRRKRRIGSHEGANCSFEFGVICGAAHGCGNPAGSSNEQVHEEAKRYGHTHDHAPVRFTRETGGTLLSEKIKPQGR